MRKSVPIIHTSAALESLTNRGITLNSAIRECVDNSWDWMGDARVLGHAKIRIHLVMNNGRLTVSILDNGQGIADHVEEGTRGEGTPIDVSTSTSIDGLQMALRVGGRIQKPRLAAIGRFGFGLPQSGIALCYDTHTRVHSKTKHGQWRWLDLNVNDMIASITQEHPQPLLDRPQRLVSLHNKKRRLNGFGQTAEPWFSSTTSILRSTKSETCSVMLKSLSLS